MSVVELLMVDQFMDARLEHETFKVSQHKFEVLLTNALEWLRKITPYLVVQGRTRVQNYRFVSLLENRD